MNQKGFAHLALVITILVVAGIGGYLAFQSKSKQNGKGALLAEQKDLAKVVDTEASSKMEEDITKGWKTYINTGLGFQLQIPSEVGIKVEHNDQYNRLAFFEGSYLSFEVRLLPGRNDLDGYLYLDVPQSGRGKLDDQPAVTFVNDGGYCDAGFCGQPFISYAARYGPDYYHHLTFYGDTSLSEIESAILKNFRFISEVGPTVGWKTYTNQKYGFSLRYPPDWTVEENGSSIALMPKDFLNSKRDMMLEISPVGPGRPSILDDPSNAYWFVGISLGARSAMAYYCPGLYTCLENYSYMKDMRLRSYPSTWTTNNEISFSLRKDYSHLVDTYNLILETFKFD